jgi:type IV pilus assembly protein PilP
MIGVRYGIAAFTVLALLLAGCQQQETGPKTADYQKQRAEIIARRAKGGGARVARAADPAPGQQEAAPEDAGFGGDGDRSYAYDPIGKRDPFRSFILDRLKELEATAKGPLEQFDLAQLTVLGVVWETNEPRAFVADPSGQGYIVRAGDPIGTNSGSVIQIDDNLMLVRETYIDHMGEQTQKDVEMRVRRNQEG